MSAEIDQKAGNRMANVESLTEHLAATKVLPLYTATDMSLLDPLEELLIKHDIRLIEVTFRSELALKAIEHLARSGKLLVGAGTVRTLEEAQQAVAKGPSLLSPSYCSRSYRSLSKESDSDFSRNSDTK